MHKCVRCKRTVASLEEINDGCTCGSKVFTFIREDGEEKTGKNGETAGGSGTAGGESKEADAGKAPESYFARMTFTTEDVENIKVMTEGVFLVDVNALSKNPVVLKDEEGIYYVKIPFGQNSNGKKKK